MMNNRIRILILLFAGSSLFVAGQVKTYTVEKAAMSSDKYDEFSPVIYKGGVVFCTDRNDGFATYTDARNKSPFKINYYRLGQNLSWKDADVFSKELTSRLNDGPVTFNAAGDTMYFSRNLIVDGKLSDISGARNKLGVFSAVYANGKWGKVRELRFNIEWYNITTPWLSPDGQRLYFASDKPDGYGGFDLYYCQWKKDYWDNPVNLGPQVNTIGNEAYPYVNSEGALFFSSDGHEGLGGKDIFYTKQAGNDWIKPVPLDAPVNSKYDDFGFVADPLMDEGYFSSERGRTTDIYHFRTNINQIFYCVPQRTNEYCFRFTDDDKILLDEKYQIDEKYVEYVWSFGADQKEIGLNVDHCFSGPGKYNISLDIIEKATGRLYFRKIYYQLELKDIEQPIIDSPMAVVRGDSVKFSGAGSFFPGCEIVKYTWQFGDGFRSTGKVAGHVFSEPGEYEVQLGLMLRNVTTGKIFESCSSIKTYVFASSSIRNNFEAGRNEIPVRKNINAYDHAYITGKYSAEKDFSQDAVFQLEVLKSKEKLGIDDSSFSRIPPKYKVRELSDRKDNTYSYVVAEERKLMDLYPAFNDLYFKGYSNVRIKPVLLDDPAARELNNLKNVLGVSADVLFKPNEAALSQAGTQLLDLVIGFMAKYSGVRLELAVHTDDSGPENSNMLFTQRRAESMVTYLVLNGVSIARLVPKGYGESRPITMNSDNDEREANRRVDFQILR